MSVLDSNAMQTSHSFRPCVGPSRAVLTTTVITVLAVCVPAWYLGMDAENQRLFLRNYRISSDSEARFAICADYATNSAEPYDVVFIGGSTCSTGIQVRQFELLTGLRAYNTGTMGAAGIDGHRLLIQKYLDHHPTPLFVMLCVHPSEIGPPTSLRRLPQETDRDDSTTLVQRFLWCYGKPDGVARIFDRVYQTGLKLPKLIRDSLHTRFGSVLPLWNYVVVRVPGEEYWELI